MIISLGLNVNMVLIYVYLRLNLVSNIISCSPVYTCFLDASEAYYRVNHWSLFRKLLNRSIHILIVILICFGTLRKNYLLGGELKCRHILLFLMEYDGRILSPSLFAVYMDISSLLNMSRIGCHIDDVCINHACILYADDLCLMAPCAIVLQELINVCYQYSNANDLNFNATKSFCVAFTPNYYKLSMPPLFMNSMPILYADSIKYLGFNFTSNNCADADILKQMRMLYRRSNRLVRLFNKCSKPGLLELCRNFCTVFYCYYSSGDTISL